MNKYFDEFLIKNNLKAKNINCNKFILLVDRVRFNQAFLSSFYTILFNKKYLYTPLVLSDSKNIDLIRFYKSFGFNIFIKGFRYKLILYKPYLFLKSIFLTIRTIILIKKKGFLWFVNKFKLVKIKIGDLVYDEYIRHFKGYLNENKIDIRFINILFKAIFRTYNIIDILKAYNIKVIVLGTETYANNSGIALRIGLENKIKVVEPSLINLDFFEFKRRHIIHGKHNLFYNNKLKKIISFEKDIRKIDKFLENRFKGKVKTRYTHRNHIKLTNGSPKFINKNNFLKIHNLENYKFKKIVLFSCHAFSDANHGLGSNFLFKDYYDHLKSTVEFINKENNPNILWIIRPNPTTIFDGEYEIVKKLIKKINNKKIIICKKNINSSNLLKICDNVITGRGTVGMEFACEGKYPIIVGSGTYSNLGFSLEFKNINEYFSLLKNIINVKKLSNNKRVLAKRTLYYLEKNADIFFLENFDYEKKKFFINNSKFLIDENILQNLRNKKNYFFSKRLISNLKNFKLENNYYIDYMMNKI